MRYNWSLFDVSEHSRGALSNLTCVKRDTKMRDAVGGERNYDDCYPGT